MNLENNPIDHINTNASKIKEEDIGTLVEELMCFYSGKINSFSSYVYGSENAVALSAFKEYAATTFNKGLSTFLFKSQHWRTGRNIGPYLITCLSKLADHLKSDINFIKKVSIPICPVCKSLGNREFLTYEGKLLRCAHCTSEAARLELLENKSSHDEILYRLHKVFSLHSRKGYYCPDCDRFIPESLVKSTGTIRVSCPYDNCSWFGIASELELMTHPMGQSSNMTMSLNASISTQSKSIQFQDTLDAKEVSADIRLEQSEKYRRELDIAKAVISAQKAKFSKQPMFKVFRKYLMYQSFEQLLNQDPEGMIGYLIHGKSLGERPIQSLIFQNYIQLIENKLPFKIEDDDGKLVEVFSLLDPGMNLFLGTSEFKSYVRESGIISNNTYEIYVGAKCNGPCFIGLLCDIKDSDGKSLLSDVEYYTFSNIKMKNTIPQNTIVTVTHFRIPPHYEMFSLVNLQRTRKCIITSINKRLGIKGT
jgi:hypothetical protein